ncbi:flagellar basal body P-ring formation chaperone FlgA [Yoonia sp. 208BN28-4]|uniref:flagellar basal body P-ring formation chaperone FlgA n=1 Tax=Yoonia sp. 208BN28-4 TaxID=3126505 RepID=UPI003094EAF1
MIRLALILIGLASSGFADMVVPVRTLPAQTLISAGDIALRDGAMPGGVSDPSQIIGKEARIALFAGRPIRLTDVGAPAIVERNQILSLIYNRGGLVIATEGRALDRAGAGELIRVMNIASRSTVSARIGADGAAYVSQ